MIGLLPGGSAFIEIAEYTADVWERWKKRKPKEEDRREELQALAHVSAEQVEAAVQAAIEIEAAGQPPAVKRKLTSFLIEVQVVVRRTMLRNANLQRPNRVGQSANEQRQGFAAVFAAPDAAIQSRGIETAALD